MLLMLLVVVDHDGLQFFCLNFTGVRRGLVGLMMLSPIMMVCDSFCGGLCKRTGGPEGRSDVKVMVTHMA